MSHLWYPRKQQGLQKRTNSFSHPFSLLVHCAHWMTAGNEATLKTHCTWLFSAPQGDLNSAWNQRGYKTRALGWKSSWKSKYKEQNLAVCGGDACFPQKKQSRRVGEEMPSRAVTHCQLGFSLRSFSVAKQRWGGTFPANMGWRIRWRCGMGNRAKIKNKSFSLNLLNVINFCLPLRKTPTLPVILGKKLDLGSWLVFLCGSSIRWQHPPERWIRWSSCVFNLTGDTQWLRTRYRWKAAWTSCFSSFLTCHVPPALTGEGRVKMRGACMYISYAPSPVGTYW